MKRWAYIKPVNPDLKNYWYEVYGFTNFGKYGAVEHWVFINYHYAMFFHLN